MGIDLTKNNSLDNLNPITIVDKNRMRIERINFYLITSLGTSRMRRWLPVGTPRTRNMICLGGNWIVTRRHLRHVAPLVNAYRAQCQHLSYLVNQLDKLAPGYDTWHCRQAIMENVFHINQQIPGMMPKINEVGKIVSFSNPIYFAKTIFDCYCEAFNYSPSRDELLCDLEEKFNCRDMSIWAPVHLDYRSNWHCNSLYYPCLTSNMPPYSQWVKGESRYGWNFNVFYTATPLRQNTQLSSSVKLTDDLVLTRNNRDLPFYADVSWWGGEEGIPYADWKQLYGKNIQFIIYNNKTKKMAGKIRYVLERIGIKVTFFELAIPDEFQLYPYPAPDSIRVNMPGDRVQTEPAPTQCPFIEIKDTKYQAINYLQTPLTISPGSVSMLYSTAGIGKTWFAMSFAYSLACGKGLCGSWKSIEQMPVFYIDGEMGESQLKNRLSIIEKMYNVPLTDNKFFHCISLNHDVISLSEVGGQNRIDMFVHQCLRNQQNKKYLIIIDNILSVTNYSDHPKGWNLIFKWVKKMKDEGASVIFIHHANAQGVQRGSTIKTAVLDNVIRVEKQDVGRNIELILNFEKRRDVSSSNQQKFKLRLCLNDKRPGWIALDAKKSKNYLDELLHEWLESHDLKDSLDWKNLHDLTGYSRDAIYKRKKQLLSEQPCQDKKGTGSVQLKTPHISELDMLGGCH